MTPRDGRKQSYCLGFVFTQPEGGNLLVTMIRRKTGEMFAGLMNGVGGKVDDSEWPRRAMQREWFEETGTNVKWHDCAETKLHGTLQFPDAQVVVFSEWLELGELNELLAENRKWLSQQGLGRGRYELIPTMTWALNPENVAPYVSLIVQACLNTERFELTLK